MTVNVRVQEMDLLPVRQFDNRRLEVVVDGLPLFRGAQLAIDTTMVSPIRRDGTTRRQCASTNGAALLQARRSKERTYPELAGDMERARLVVLFLSALAEAKARCEPEVVRKSAMVVWLRRWSVLMACTAARAFALSLMDRRCCFS